MWAVMAVLEEEESLGQEANRRSALMRRLKTQATMQGYCEVVRELGARFYTQINEGPEARELGLFGD